ncbi:helix-turn-helix transcriptional regulator [Thiomicrorhabdus indica]|uniref:helix-turn-helix domain-containing protein n=1 Tax=Thiomicrorhabdus indica TaxID=2267253 RepID=UPI002AA92ADD|nr:helix-turn-helix transcriptional regulator [Thiomicrorhabdus indica]
MEKEKEIENGNSVPIQEETMGTRIKEVASSLGTRKYAAEVAGVAPDTLQRWFKGEASPSFESISRLAMEADYSMEWIKTGRGAKGRNDPKACNPDIDQQVADEIVSVMLEYGYIDDRKKDAIMNFIRIYNDSIDRPYRNQYKRLVLIRLKAQIQSSIENSERMIEQYADEPLTQEIFESSKKANLEELEKIQNEINSTFEQSKTGRFAF